MTFGSRFEHQRKNMTITLKASSTTLFRKFLPCLLAATVSVALASCSSGGDSDSDSGSEVPFSDPNENIPDIVDATIAEQLLGDQFVFSTLVERLQQADLVDALSDDNNGEGWTVFAPENAVFGSDPVFQNLTLAQQIEAVEGHVASGTFLSTDLIPGQAITMQDGSQAFIELAPDGMNVTVGGASITSRDRRVNNGVIHRVGTLITTE